MTTTSLQVRQDQLASTRIVEAASTTRNCESSSGASGACRRPIARCSRMNLACSIATMGQRARTPVLPFETRIGAGKRRPWTYL